MRTLSAFDPSPYTLLDTDIATSATARSLVYRHAAGMSSLSLELHVTLLGSTPVNLLITVLGENAAPALETTRLIPLTLALPTTSALVAALDTVILLPVAAVYGQFEVTVVSGGNVHVKAYISGSEADFTGQAASGAASLVQLAAGSADAGTVHLATGGVVGLTGAVPAGANAIGSVTLGAALPAGTNAIGTVGVTVYAPYIDTVASADTSAHAYATSQVVKAPVFVRVARTTTGIVTISDGTRTGMALTAGDTMPLHCTNLNQINYQFSVNASATEKFSISAGI